MLYTPSHTRLVITPDIERCLQSMIPRQIIRLALCDPSGVVREPDCWSGCDELGRIEDACHLFCVVCKREWREVWRCVGVRASRSFGGG